MRPPTSDRRNAVHPPHDAPSHSPPFINSSSPQTSTLSSSSPLAAALGDAAGRMDPWKDDRLRDFVILNLQSRLRSFHLPASAAPAPASDINQERLPGLVLLGRTTRVCPHCANGEDEKVGAVPQQKEGCPIRQAFVHVFGNVNLVLKHHHHDLFLTSEHYAAAAAAVRRSPSSSLGGPTRSDSPPRALEQTTQSVLSTLEASPQVHHPPSEAEDSTPASGESPRQVSFSPSLPMSSSYSVPRQLSGGPQTRAHALHLQKFEIDPFCMASIQDTRCCAECVEDICRYYQNLVNRGVIIDRFSQKELLFAHWVIARDMVDLPLETHSTLARKEAMATSLKNMYYDLLRLALSAPSPAAVLRPAATVHQQPSDQLSELIASDGGAAAATGAGGSRRSARRIVDAFVKLEGIASQRKRKAAEGTAAAPPAAEESSVPSIAERPEKRRKRETAKSTTTATLASPSVLRLPLCMQEEPILFVPRPSSSHLGDASGEDHIADTARQIERALTPFETTTLDGDTVTPSPTATLNAPGGSGTLLQSAAADVALLEETLWTASRGTPWAYAVECRRARRIRTYVEEFTTSRGATSVPSPHQTVHFKGLCEASHTQDAQASGWIRAQPSLEPVAASLNAAVDSAGEGLRRFTFAQQSLLLLAAARLAPTDRFVDEGPSALPPFTRTVPRWDYWS